MKKKLSIALLAFSLAMLCANFIVRRIGKFFPPSQQEIEEREQDFSPFAAVKQNEEVVIDSSSFVRNSEEIEQNPEKEIVKPILKFELTKEEKETVEAYSKNPKMQAFIKEISAVV